MKEYSEDITNQGALASEESIPNDSWNINDKINNALNKFPKEFQKKISQAFDKRFWVILLITFFFCVTVIFLLQKFFPYKIDSNTIIKIQEQYAHLLINDTFKTPQVASKVIESDYKLSTQVITGLSKWMDSFTDDMFETIKELPAFTPEAVPEVESKEVSVPTKEEISAAREKSTQRRQTSLKSVENDPNYKSKKVKVI